MDVKKRCISGGNLLPKEDKWPQGCCLKCKSRPAPVSLWICSSFFLSVFTFLVRVLVLKKRNEFTTPGVSSSDDQVVDLVSYGSMSSLQVCLAMRWGLCQFQSFQGSLGRMFWDVY